MQFALIPAVFLVVFVIFAVGVWFLVPVIAQHFKGAAGGWSRLAEVYATTRHLPTRLLRRQTVVVGHILYRNCITVGFDDTGLYLAPGFPISIFGKRTLFFPWTEFTRVEEGRLFWSKAAVLSLGKPLVGTITVPMELFNNAIRPAIDKAATDLPADRLWIAVVPPALFNQANPGLPPMSRPRLLWCQKRKPPVYQEYRTTPLPSRGVAMQKTVGWNKAY